MPPPGRFKRGGKPGAPRKPKRRSDAERGPANREMKLDYKDLATLQKFVTARGKLFSRSRSGLNAHSQRELAIAIKRARFMALMPFVGK